MARDYGQIMSAIWNDPTFRALTGAAQRAYLLLITQHDISSAGTLPMTLNRWAGYDTDTTPDALSDALSELERHRFVVLDRDLEELLVRKFVKWDNGYRNEKRRAAITKAANTALSPRIRATLAVELDTLGVPHALSDAPSDRASDAPSDARRVVVKEVSTTHNPEPEPESRSVAVAHEVRPAQKRGTRLSDEWRPSDETRIWTLERLSPTDAGVELEKFRNYWLAKTGKDATKLDWERTFRNWILNAHGGTRASPPASRPSTTETRVNDALSRARQHRLEITG